MGFKGVHPVPVRGVIGATPDTRAAILGSPCGISGPIVEAKTIVCDGHKPSGLTCGETAVIHSAQYVYNSFMFKPGMGGRMDPNLQETHYDVECPHCGRRTQVVKANGRGPLPPL
jgi:hypothetical protein